MASGYKRKADDNRIIELNSVGISLTRIAEQLGVHPTTVTYRLQAMGIPPVDTRRAFMEDIYDALPPKQQEWLISKLDPGYSVKDLIRSLIMKEYASKVAS